MKIFMPSVHPRRTKGVAASLNVAGIDLYIAGKTFKPDVGIHRTYSPQEAKDMFGPNVYTYEEDEIYLSPPDIVISGREDSELKLFEVVELIRQTKQCSFCLYSGNFHSNFQWDLYQGAVCTDAATISVARWKGIPAIEFRPMFSFDAFPFKEGSKAPTVKLKSYIQTFSERYPTAFKLHEEITARYNTPEWSDVEIENVRDKSLSEVERIMSDSTATVHIKDQEGFGWSVLESMSVGRPLILQSGLAKHMAFKNWAIEGETALYFDTVHDLDKIVMRLRDDVDWRINLQKRTAARIRQIYDAHSSARDLGNFLILLNKIETYRWLPGVARSNPVSSVSPHRPSIDDKFQQGFELIDRKHLHPNKVTIPAAALYSAGKYTSEGTLEISNSAGRSVIAWGPFISLEPGDYTAKIRFKGTAKKTVTFDMTRLHGSKPPEVTWTTVHEFSGDEEEILTEFQSLDRKDRLEFRTLINGETVPMTIIDIEFSKV